MSGKKNTLTIYDVGKRIMDLTLSSIVLLLFSPVMLVVIFAIKLESPGPVLADTPERVGKTGKRFKMFKFRSMVQNAHQMLREDPRYRDLFTQYKKGSYKLR